jgi:type VI secretion system protein ImpM
MAVDAGAPAAAAPGWYGKLSTLGDFAGRRLPPAVQQTLDHWLSEVLAGSRAQLGEDWLQRYLDSPLQRFVLGPEVIGAGWWFGTLMPSCDNVGRYFPLVVLQARAAPPTDRPGLEHLDRWWQGAGEASLETLADEVDVERFDRALAGLPPWPDAPAAHAAHAATGWPPAWPSAPTDALHLPAACAPADLVQGLAVGEWTRRLHAHSLWWSWRPQGGASTCRLVPGLPSADVFAAMLHPAG